LTTLFLTFKPSTIHGRGGFASRPIPKGSRVIEYTGETISKSESLERCRNGNHCIFCLDTEHDLDGDVPWNPARLLNHSCAPNCEVELLEGGVWIVANRNIAAGEEITFSYNFDLVDYKEHPCHCGSPDCVGYIVAEEFFPQLRELAPLRH
jgi:SET domain-containing protein